MSEHDHKKLEELKKMAEEVRRDVRSAVSEARAEIEKASEEIKYALSLELDVVFASEHTVAEQKHSDVRADDDFWDLGKPKERIYAPPQFSETSLSVTDVTDSHNRDGASEIGGRKYAQSQTTAQAEKIPPRESYRGSTGRVVNTPDGPRSVSQNRVVTSSYKRRSHFTQQQYTQSIRKPSETVKTYRPDGILIREVSVKTWESETEFYGRFASDAHRSHEALPKTPYTAKLEAVPYFSYVPQYAHMNMAQVEFYRYIRENIRHGIYPDCDLAYIQLYIFEIINLPEIIPSEEGAALLASIWLNYRSRHPRLDGFMCEWMADYCLIGGCPLPKPIHTIMHEIVPKAQFKEFYLNDFTSSSDTPRIFGETVLEVSSDYDYRSGRYYKDHRDEYERHIPEAAGLAMKQAKESGRGIFAMDRVYKMTRDSYSGAVVSSGIKRRIDIEFLSFTRRADTRQSVTAIAKYAENKLRSVLGIKAKLSSEGISPEDTAVIDAYFAPLMPQNVKKPKEDRYMPEDYMKNYESEDSGFDFAAAQAIEEQSWINTGRLTGDSAYTENLPSIPEYEADIPVSIDGELSSALDGFAEAEETPAEEPVSIEAFDAAEKHSEPTIEHTLPKEDAEADDEIRAAVHAALLGEFRLYCRRNNLYEGEAADRVNNVFLDEIGDIILENTGSGFELIEDYREDVENWLR